MDDIQNGDEVPEGSAVFPLIPPELSIHPLLLCVIHCVVFLDGSEANVVHPTAASETLEYIAGYLQRLNEAEIARVREDLICLATYGRKQGWTKQQLRFLKDFLEDFGVRSA